MSLVRFPVAPLENKAVRVNLAAFLFPDVVLMLLTGPLQGMRLSINNTLMFAQRDFVGQETLQLIPLSSNTYILSSLP